MREIWRIFEALVALALLAGCAGQTFSPDAAPEFLVTRAQAPFYRLGPQQAGPPDARLAVDDRVRMLRREFGYSFMQIFTGETGYMANEDIRPAPLALAAPEETESLPRKVSVGERDLPPVEEPLPKPDMGAQPADAPAL